MLSYKRGKVIEILYEDEDILKLKIQLDDRISDAINYKHITGSIEIGDELILNTTAVELGLGTGGVDFVINNLKNNKKSFTENGHIMKLRYTPLQIKCLAAESEESPYHKKFLEFESLNGHIVIVGSLHSMLAPIASTLKYINSDLNINYIMTDGGCLPIDFSDTVRKLKEDNIINKTITIGQAFGGDIECVNIYNGLIASKEILNSDITIITMGPGIVGTGTKYGFSGIEQGEIINAIESLGGKSIMVPRVGFHDKRERHLGLSHHTKTVLEDIVKVKTTVVFNIMNEENKRILDSQIDSLNINDNVEFIFKDGNTINKAIEKYNYNTTTMGRGIDKEKDYFLTLGAVAEYSYDLLKEEEKKC